MLKKIVGVFICMLMISGALASANTVIRNFQSANIEDGTISLQIMRSLLRFIPFNMFTKER